MASRGRSSVRSSPSGLSVTKEQMFRVLLKMSSMFLEVLQSPQEIKNGTKARPSQNKVLIGKK